MLSTDVVHLLFIYFVFKLVMWGDNVCGYQIMTWHCQIQIHKQHDVRVCRQTYTTTELYSLSIHDIVNTCKLSLLRKACHDHDLRS